MWVKLHDKLLEWEWYGDPNMVALWIHLLLTANHKDRRWRGIEVKRGQLVAGRIALSEATGISEQTIRTCLARLKETNEITIKSTNKYSIITICNYESYQDTKFQTNQQTNQQLTSDQPTTNQQLTTLTDYIDRENILSNDNIKNNSLCENVVLFFNETIKANNSIIPTIRGSNGKRKEAIHARIREYGIEAVYEMITKASTNDFLNGKNARSWRADFDWLFKPSNFQKVLEGNYENRTNTNATNERAQRAAGYAAVIARLAAEDDARQENVR